MRKVIRSVLALLIILLAAVSLLVGAAVYLNSSPAGEGGGKAAAFTIAKGESLQAVAGRLQELQLIQIGRASCRERV